MSYQNKKKLNVNCTFFLNVDQLRKRVGTNSLKFLLKENGSWLQVLILSGGIFFNPVVRSLEVSLRYDVSITPFKLLNI